MCVVSNIGDGWSKTVPDKYPWVQPVITPGTGTMTPNVSREEFEALRNEIQELRKLLLAAKDFDAATGQPDCEVDEKVDLIKRLAEMVGVDMTSVFGDNDSQTETS